MPLAPGFHMACAIVHRPSFWHATTHAGCSDPLNMNPFFPVLAQAADNPAGVFFGLGAIGLILALVLSLFWLWMLIDSLTNASLDPTMKIVWALVIFFLPFIGAVLYFFVGRRSGSPVPR
jgi:hypothetical protein